MGLSLRILPSLGIHALLTEDRLTDEGELNWRTALKPALASCN